MVMTNEELFNWAEKNLKGLNYFQRRDFLDAYFKSVRNRTQRSLKQVLREHNIFSIGGILKNVEGVMKKFRESKPTINLIFKSPIEERLGLELIMERINFSYQHKEGRYIIDFAFPYAHLAVECDGADYHTTKEQIRRDQTRDKYLNSRGWVLLRFTGVQIHNNLKSCMLSIKQILKGMGN